MQKAVHWWHGGNGAVRRGATDGLDEAMTRHSIMIDSRGAVLRVFATRDFAHGRPNIADCDQR